MMRIFRDSDFIREENNEGKLIPMTKEEVRSAVLLKLSPDISSICWDIGAGTGSVSLQLAEYAANGMVYSFERNKDACELISKNMKSLDITNVKVVFGEFLTEMAKAEACEYPVPNVVFIGGSDGKLIDIIIKVRDFAKTNNIDPDLIRFAFSAVTIETVSIINEVKKLSEAYSNMEIIQLSVSRTRKLGSHELFAADNPVFLCSFGGRSE